MNEKQGERDLLFIYAIITAILTLLMAFLKFVIFTSWSAWVIAGPLGVALAIALFMLLCYLLFGKDEW